MVDEPLPAADDDPRSQPSRVLPLIVACALFMETLEATAIATALPHIASDLGEDPVALKLALTTYMVGLAMFIPLSTWLADVFGTRTVFCSAIAVFVLGATACACSQQLGVLILSRFVQSVGGAMMVPVGRMLLLRTVPRRHLVRTLSYLAIPAMLGPIIGPAIGGLITEYGHWRAIFLVNLPLAVVAMSMAVRHMPQIQDPMPAPLDTPGFLLAALALGATNTGLAGLGRSLLAPALAWSLCGCGLMAAALYVRHAKTCDRAILDLALFRLPTFASGVIGGGLFRFGIGATPFLLSLLFQLVFGLDAARTGFLLMVGAIAALGTKTIAVRAVAGMGFRALLLWNGLLAATLIALCGVLTPATPLPMLLAVLFLGGAFRSLQFTGLHSISYADVPPHRMGAATALASVTQQVSLGLGVTLAAQVLSLSQELGERSAPGSIDFSWAFALVAACSGLSLAWVWRLDPSAGAELAHGARSSR